ncbi:MAG: hypothetical protein CBD16_03050 [Betaproteobacteria bacterium TMED156]|nr:MAG: hypothetical protein CBD16_03050 [Betaproteobacteria bacterium TMED156]
MVDFHSVIVGGGVIGLAIGRALSMSGKETLVLENASRHGTGTSSRNSGVIHAGIYYPKNSLKAKLCVRGKELLYEYVKSHKVLYKQLGKLIVGQSVDEAKLQTINEKAINNGVDDLRWLSKKEITKMEPELNVSQALLSPSTGIVDVHSLMHAYEGDLISNLGQIAVKSRFLKAEQTKQNFPEWKVWVTSSEESEAMTFSCNQLINAAGLDADAVANQIQSNKKVDVPQIYYAKGNYVSLTKSCPFNHLIYPTPVPGGLGTHLTLDMGGQGQFGPDVEWLGPVNRRRLPGSSFESINYNVDESKLEKFAEDVRRWWPSINVKDLAPAYSGVRPKLSAPNEPASDFYIEGPNQSKIAGLIQLFGIESPGLTASLAIAEHVLEISNDQQI